jgi:hypothetical protein
LAPEEIRTRLAALAGLRTDAERLAAAVPEAKRDAFEQLVGYPVCGAEIVNRRYFHGELGERDQALAADAELKETTRRFNEETAGGKWRGMTSLEPADKQFQSMRVYPWQMPAFPLKETMPEARIVIEAGGFSSSADRNGSGWKPVSGLGVTLLPTTAPSFDPARLATDAPQLDYTVDLSSAGGFTLTLHLLPTHSIVPSRGLSLAVGLDNLTPQVLTYAGKDGSAEWAQGVLNNEVTVSAPIDVLAPGKHTLRVYGIDAGVVLRKLSLTGKDR